MVGGCACNLRDEFMKIYTRSHKMSFIHVHILQRPKAIHVNGYKSVEEPVKVSKGAKLKYAQFLPYICCLQT